MKFSSIGRASLASLLSLSACLGFTACSRNYTVAYLYVTATATAAAGAGTSNGVVNAYQVDYQSGSVLQFTESFPTAGQNPTAVVATVDQKNLFVANGDTSNIAPFYIGTDGKLYLHDQFSTVGSNPVAMALSGDNKFLYVLTSLKGGGVTSGTGQVEVFPISDKGIPTKTPVFITSVGLNPVGIAASLDNGFVYVIHRDPSTTANLIGFSRNTTTGALTPLAGTTITATKATGYSSGVEPSSIVEDPKSRYLYVTDRVSNQIIGYTFNAGVPVPMNNGPFATGSYPVGSTIDPRGKYLYVVNYNSNSVSAYALDPSTGTLSSSTGSTGTQTGTGPVCVTIENALGKYLYTANRLDNTVTGLQLNASTGAVQNIQGTPFSTSSLPSCAVAVANGEHATQIVQ